MIAGQQDIDVAAKTHLELYFRPAEIGSDKTECRGEIVTLCHRGFVMCSPIKLEPDTLLSLRLLFPTGNLDHPFPERQGMGHVVSERRLPDGTVGYLIQTEVVFSGTRDADLCDGSHYIYFRCQEMGEEDLEYMGEPLEVFAGGFLLKGRRHLARGTAVYLRTGPSIEFRRSPFSGIRTLGRVIREQPIGSGKVGYLVNCAIETLTRQVAATTSC